MIPIEKVQQIVNTYETLEKELASGNVDKKDFVKKSKEYSSISEIINEAKGYAIERINTAEGDATLFELVLKEYNKAPQITRDRYYIETMNTVLGNAPNKVIVDSQLENFLPMMNLKNKGSK